MVGLTPVRWALLALAACSIVVAALVVRWWMRIGRLDHAALEKELAGDESSHLPWQRRMAIADAIKSKLAILVVFVILAACVLSWKALQAFISA